MYKLKALEYNWIIVFISILCCILTGALNTGEKKIICYFDSNIVKPETTLQSYVNSIDVNLCTHLIYSSVPVRALLDDTAIASDQNLDRYLERYSNFTQLKLKNPKLKTIISIREDESRNSQFSTILRNNRSRENFTKNILKFIKDFNFDGIDIIWENPRSGNGHKCDKKNYVTFLKEIRSAFSQDATKLMQNPFSISIGIPYDISDAQNGYDIPKLNQYVDWFNVMGYDSYQLYSIESNSSNYNYPIENYLKAGISRDKMILGISTYGLLFTIKSFTHIDDLYKNILDNPKKAFELADNIEQIPLSDVCKNIKNNPDWKLFREQTGSLTRIFALNKNDIIIFKDVSIIRDKVEYIVDMDLGGMLFSSINQDDIEGFCSNQPYPLVETAKKLLLQKLSLRNSRSTTISNGEEISNQKIRNRIVCYTTSWSIYRTGPARFNQYLLDPNLCTHVIYAYAKVEEQTILFADENSDITLGGYADFMRQRSENKNLKLLIGVRVVDKEFSNTISNSETRKSFIDSLLKHLNTYGFDGADIVWKYPETKDKDNFVELLKELKAKFIEESKSSNRTEPYLLSITIPSEIEFIDSGYDLKRLNNYVDWYNLLSYDYHFSKESIINHHAPLYAIDDNSVNNTLNVNASVSYYLNAGIERTKLVVGIPTYGISFTLADPKETAFGSVAKGPGIPGRFTNISGAISYFEICDSLQTTSNWKIIRPYPRKVGPYIVNEDQWIAYDDELMIQVKAEYVADTGLGGIMFWTADQDDFRGICGFGPNILIETAKKALLNKISVGNSNLISTTTPSIVMLHQQATDSTESITLPVTTEKKLPSASVFKDRINRNINNRIVCYTTNWSVYRTGAGRFSQNLIDPFLCTHIIYAYGKITENNTFTSSDTLSDITFDGYYQLNKLKEMNPNLRTLIAVRDYSTNITLFPAIVVSKERRKQLIQSIVDFLDENDFNGIDIGWKHPKQNESGDFVKFVEEINEKFLQESLNRSQEPYLISIQVPAKKEEMSGYDMTKLNEYVDWFNVLSYNYHIAVEKNVNHPAQLYALPENPLDELNVNFTVTQYLNNGADRSKLVITIPAYGRTFTLADKSQTIFGSPAIAPGRGGHATKTAGNLAYYEVCEYILQDSSWKIFKPYPKLVGPYIVKDDQWVSFDDENMIQTKADYVADHGYGGMGFWTIDQDDFQGICDGIPFILIKTAKNKLNEKLGIRDELPVTQKIMSEQLVIIKDLNTTDSSTVKNEIIGVTESIKNAQLEDTQKTSKSNSTEINSIINVTNTNDGIDVNSFEERRDRIVCYTTNWSTYRAQTARFDPTLILPDLCTHLIYAYAVLENDTVVSSDPNVDITRKGYENFNLIKLKNPDLKTLISITQKENFTQFTDLANDPERRQIFVNNLLNFVKLNGFNGADIAWQYPGSNPTDKENFVQLLREINQVFKDDAVKTQSARLLLTIPVPSEIILIDRGYDIIDLNDILDWFNLLSYDYHNPNTELFVNHHAPLYTLPGVDDSENNINATVNHYLEAGVQISKLVLGIPTYGITFTLKNEDMTAIMSPAIGPGTAGELTKNAGNLAYYEICKKFVEDGGWQIKEVDPPVMGPYAFKGTQWIAYDDEAMLRRKAEYVANNGLGGLMFWTIDQDDFIGICGQPNALIQASKKALLEKLSVRTPVGPERPDTQPQVIDLPPIDTTTKKLNNTELSKDFACSAEGLFPNPIDCKSYYACLDIPEIGQDELVSQLLSCSPGTFYNSAKEKCTALENDQQCGFNIKQDTAPISSTEGILIPPTIITPSPITQMTSTSSTINEDTSNQLLQQLIKNSGGIEKFLQLFNKLSMSSTQAPITVTENMRGITIVTPMNFKKTESQIPESKTKGIISSQDHIYQIRELHIHNYGKPIIDEKGLDQTIKTSDSLRNILETQPATGKETKPYIVLAPVQVINKVYN